MTTDSLGTLQKAWPSVRFGDVVKQSGEKTDPEADGIERYVAGEHMESDDLRIRRWGTVGDGYLGPAFHKRFRPGQVLYGSRRTYLRKVAVADFDGVCANTTFVLVSASEQLLQDFLPHVMSTESFHAYSIGKSRGSTNPYVNFSDLVDYEFALPPLEVQKRIVELLRTVSTSEERLSAVLSAAVAAQSAYLDALITGLEESSPSQDLGSVAEVVMGQSPPSETYNSQGKGLPFLQGSAEFGPASPVPVKWCTEPRKIAEAGDLLISVRAPVGHMNVAHCRLAIGRGLARVRSTERLNSDYLQIVFALRAHELTRMSSGSTFDGISGSNLRAIKIVVPPIHLQARVVATSAMFDGLKAAAQSQLHALSRLRLATINDLAAVQDV